MDRAQRKPASSSPGSTLLTNALSISVAEQLCGATFSYGLIAEAASEARGTCALLAHPSTARTVVTQTMDTATVYRKEKGLEKLDRKQGFLGARIVAKD